MALLFFGIVVYAHIFRDICLYLGGVIGAKKRLKSGNFDRWAEEIVRKMSRQKGSPFVRRFFRRTFQESSARGAIFKIVSGQPTSLWVGRQ